MLRLALALALTCVSCQSSATRPQVDRPNIVVLYADDLGWRDLSCQGSRFYETPHIDRLAKQGMRFGQAYACAPNCAPSRACLMTGKYTPRHGVYTVASSARGQSKHRRLIPIKNTTVLRDDFVTLPETLRTAGYRCAHFGKWHLGKDPKSQGFDVNVGGNRAGHPKSYYSPYSNADLSDGPKGEHLTARIGREACAFIEKNASRRFFAYVSFFAVHTPIQPPRGRAKRFRDKAPDGAQKNARYAALVAALDDAVGAILAKLEELGLADNTVVVFSSDNGGHGQVTSQAPLRGAKGMLYEGGVRVPLIVRWPGQVEPGTRCAQPVIGVDVYPTLCEVTGADAPKDLDGKSIVPILQARGDWSRGDALYWHFPAYLALNGRKGTWRTTPAGAIRKGRYKLIEFFENGRRELYDLEADIGESRDLATERPELARELHAELVAWRTRTRAPVPTERNPDYEGR